MKNIEASYIKKNYKYKNLNIVYYIFVNVDNANIKSQPIIFLPGVCANGLIIEDTLRELSKKYEVVSLDLPCFGESNVTDSDWSMDDYADLLISFIEESHLENIILIGHSLGGLISLYLSSRCDKVTKQIIIDSTGNLPKYNLVEYFYRLLVLENIYTITNYKSGFQNLLIFYYSYFQFFFARFFYLSRITKIMQKCFYHDFEEYQNIKVETIIFWGKDDILIPLSYGKILNNKIKSSELIIVDGAHGWFKYNEPKLLALLGRYLD